MAKTVRPVMDIPALIRDWLDQGKTFEEIADENEIMDGYTGQRLTATELQAWYDDKANVRKWYQENTRQG